MSYLKITSHISKQNPNELEQAIAQAIEKAYLEKDPNAHVQIHCHFDNQNLQISGQIFSDVDIDTNAIAQAELEKSQPNKKVDFYPSPVKYKYLDFIPKPKHLDKRTYDLVNEEEFFKTDGRLPLLLVTQHGIYPPSGHYDGQPQRNLSLLEGLEHQTIGLIAKVYLSGYEYKGIQTLYVDDELIASLKEDTSFLNTGLWKGNVIN